MTPEDVEKLRLLCLESIAVRKEINDPHNRTQDDKGHAAFYDIRSYKQDKKVMDLLWSGDGICENILSIIEGSYNGSGKDNE